MCSSSPAVGATRPPQYSTSQNASPASIAELEATRAKALGAGNINAAVKAQKSIQALTPLRVTPAPDKGPTFGLRIQPEAVGAADLRNPFMPSVKRNG